MSKLFSDSFIHPVKKIICYIIAFQILILSVANFNFKYVHAAQTTILSDNFDNANEWDWYDGLISDYEFQNGRVKNTDVVDRGWLYDLPSGNEKTVTIDVYQDSNFIKNDAYTFEIVGKDENGAYLGLSYSYSKTIDSITVGDTDSVYLNEYTCTIPSNYVGVILKIRYNADMFKVGVDMTPGKVEISKLVITEQVETVKIDNLDDTTKTSWSSGLTFNTSNTNGFGDSSTVLQASDSWAWFHYYMAGAKRIEAEVFTKTEFDKNKILIETSPDATNITTPEYVKTAWQELDNGWYKVSIVSILPAGTNFAGIVLKATGNDKPQIGKVSLSDTSGVLPTDESMPLPSVAELVDPLNDLTLLNWHSIEGENGLGDLEFNTSNSNGFNDPSTIRQASNSWAMFNYHLSDAKTLEATLYTKTDITSANFAISSTLNADGSNLTDKTFVRTGWTTLQNGWFKVTIISVLPDGTKYAGLSLKGYGTDKLEVGSVSISTATETLPANQNMPGTPDDVDTTLEIIDPLNNLTLINWHSIDGQYGLGDLEFNSSNSNGFNDPSTIRQSSDLWSSFNYNLNGAKTFEATVYTKTDITPSTFDISACQNADGSNPTYPTFVRNGWTALENGWFKATIVSILPDGTNYVSLRLKGSGNFKPEVGSVSISVTPQTLPTDEEMPLEIIDPLNDFSITNWHSVQGQYDLGDLEFNTSNSNGFNDPSTIRQNSDSWSIFNYNLNNAKMLEATVYTKTAINSKVIEITASPNVDGSNETYPSYVRTGWTALQNGWFKVTIVSVLPDGTNYTGLRLKGYGSNKPEIGSIKVSKTEESLPEDSPPPSNILSASSGGGGGGYNPPIVKKEISVDFESFKMVNWHTPKIVVDRSNPEGFKDTSPKIVRKDNTTQALNFRVSDIRRAETVVYFKGNLPPLGLQYSVDDKKWESIDYEIRIEETYSSTKLNSPTLALNVNYLPLLEYRSILAQVAEETDLSSAWKKATIIGVFPEGTKVINFTLLENEEGARNPQLAKIDFKKEAGTISVNSNNIESITDKMANWYKSNWHSDGLAFETENAELFDNDSDRLVRTDNKWQCVNYKMEGLRRVEADFFFKGQKAPIIINASKDNKEWDNSVSTYIEGISNLKDGWKKAKAVAIIPEGYLYVGVQMLEPKDEYEDSDIQIGNIKITKVPGEAGPIKNGIFEDNMNDLYLMNWYSTLRNSTKSGLGELAFNTSNQNGFNDASTVRQTSDKWSIFSYKMEKVRRMEAIIYTLSDLGSTFGVEAGTKQDGSDYKECPYVTTNWEELQNGWNKTKVVALLPEGTSYVNFKLMGSEDNKPEIGNIKLFYEAGTPPVNTPFILKDNLDNWSKTSWHSTLENSSKYGMGDLIIDAPSNPIIDDNSTVRAASDKWASFNYAFDNLQRMEAIIYTKTDLNISTLAVEAGTKSNGSDFADTNYVRTDWKELDNGWYKVNITAEFPVGTKHLGIKLKNSYVEIGQINLFKTTDSTPEDESMPPRSQIIDTFADWSVANWHSEGVFLEKADPDVFSTNVNVAAVKNSAWQCINYSFYGVKKVEVIAYHKSAVPNVMVNCSTDNSAWNNLVPNILVSTEDMKNGYKMSRIVAIVPKDTNFVGVQFLANSKSDTSLKIAKVSLLREAGTTPKGTLLNDVGVSSDSGKVMKPGMEDSLKDWSKVNWHSDGLIFVNDKEKFFSDADRIMRSSDTWQGFNYKIEGVRRVEVKVFFNGDSSPTFINVSNDNKEWYSVPWHIGKITSIDGEWKTSTAYAIIPQEAKYVTIQLLVSKTGAQTPQIGHVRFIKELGELPPSMRDTIEDPLDDFSLISWHADGIKLIKDDGKAFENDTSRIGRKDNAWQGINYNVPDIRRVDVKVFYTDYPAVNINGSFDNKFYLEMDLIQGKPENLSDGWKSVIITAIIPDGIKYIGIGLNQNKGGPLAPQIGSVTLSKSEGEVPVKYVEAPKNTGDAQKVEGASEVEEDTTKKVLAVYETPTVTEANNTFFDAIVRFWYLILILLLILGALPFRKKIMSLIQNR